MAAATTTLTVRVRVAWWLRPYVITLAFWCAVMHALPDEQKLAKVIKRAIRVEPV